MIYRVFLLAPIHGTYERCRYKNVNCQDGCVNDVAAALVATKTIDT